MTVLKRLPSLMIFQWLFGSPHAFSVISDDGTPPKVTKEVENVQSWCYGPHKYQFFSKTTTSCAEHSFACPSPSFPMFMRPLSSWPSQRMCWVFPNVQFTPLFCPPFLCFLYEFSSTPKFCPSTKKDIDHALRSEKTIEFTDFIFCRILELLYASSKLIYQP